MQIKRLINRKLKRMWLIKHLFNVGFRVCSDRWYSFRDAPLLVVRFTALRLRKYSGDNKDVYDFIRQAREESQLRKFRK